MTRTGPADPSMSACWRSASRHPVVARLGSRELASVRPAARVPTVARAVFPEAESFKPAPGRTSARLRGSHPAASRPRSRRAGVPIAPCSGPPGHPLYLYLLKRPAVALSGRPSAPGRGMLCILTSPPRWLQWP